MVMRVSVSEPSKVRERAKRVVRSFPSGDTTHTTDPPPHDKSRLPQRARVFRMWHMCSRSSAG